MAHAAGLAALAGEAHRAGLDAHIRLESAEADRPPLFPLISDLIEAATAREDWPAICDALHRIHALSSDRGSMLAHDELLWVVTTTHNEAVRLRHGDPGQAQALAAAAVKAADGLAPATRKSIGGVLAEGFHAVAAAAGGGGVERRGAPL